MRKQYYKCLKLDLETHKTRIDYWYTSNPAMIINAYDFIIPLGTRKPANVDKESIKQ